MPEELIRTIRRSARSEHAVERIRNAVVEFREQYGTSATAREAEPILTAMSKIGTIPREVDPKVVDQAIEALKKANPAARELNPIISITEAGIDLNLSGNGELRDLRALAGLPIVALNLSDCAVENIQPLKGMPLQRLNLVGTSVKNLSPLRNSPIGVLDVRNSPIGNVSSLSECPNLSVIRLPQEAQGIDALRKLPSLKSISYSGQDRTGTPAEFWKEFDAVKK